MCKGIVGCWCRVMNTMGCAMNELRALRNIVAWTALGASLAGCVAVELATMSEKDPTSKRTNEFYQNSYTGNWCGDSPQKLLDRQLNPDRDSEIDERGLYSFAVTHVDYIEGPGTRRGDEISGGLFAADLDKPIKERYRILVKNIRKCRSRGIEPRIYLFGFSRGAYLCPVFSWLLQTVGVTNAELSEWNGVVDDFLLKDPVRLKSARTKGFEDSPKIALMGLWDVVSSRHDVYKGFFNGMKAPVVERVRHAMAIDERRELFPVMHYFPDDSIVQVWFPGVHSEVGGGYDDDKVLYRLSYEWMVAESEKAGLSFVEPVERKKIDWRTLKPHVPPLSGKHPCRCYWPEDEFHQSVNERAAATFKPVAFANFEPDEINANIGSVA